MTWQLMTGIVEEISEELNSHEEAIFILPNTPENRAIVAADKDVKVWYDDVLCFRGVLAGVEYEQGKLKCLLYNWAYYEMTTKDITGNYPTGTAADTILTDIGTAAGIPTVFHDADFPGGVPPNVGVRLSRTICYDAGVYLAEACNGDWWYEVDVFHIGIRGSNKGAINPITISHRSIDRAKRRDKVYVRGVDIDGDTIYGEAGVGTNVIVFNDKKADDIATLNNIAEYKLAQLNQDDSGAKITVSIDEGSNLFPGDTITLAETTLELAGSYRIWKVVKKLGIVDIEILKPEAIIEKYIEQQRNLEELGIYPISSDQLDNPPGPPAAPTGVVATQVVGGLKITWDANTEADLDRYIIYRRLTIGPGAWGELTRVDTTYFFDYNLDYDVAYDYRVTAIDRVGNESIAFGVASGSARQVIGTTDIQNDTVSPAILKIEARKWSSDLALTWDDDAANDYANPDWNHIYWHKGDNPIGTDATIKFADGTSTDIIANGVNGIGDGVWYFFWDETQKPGGKYDLQRTQISANAIGAGKGLIGIGYIDNAGSNAPTLIPVDAYTPVIGAGIVAAYAIESHQITTRWITSKNFRTAVDVGVVLGPAGIIFDSTGIYGYSGGTTKTFELASATGKVTVYGNGMFQVVKADGVTLVGYIDATTYDLGMGIGNQDVFMMHTPATKLLVLRGGVNFFALDETTNRIVLDNAWDSMVPQTDGAVDLGTNLLKFGDIWGTVKYADLNLLDTHCPRCGERFKENEDVKFVIVAVETLDGSEGTTYEQIRCVPIHARCSLWIRFKKLLGGIF